MALSAKEWTSIGAILTIGAITLTASSIKTDPKFFEQKLTMSGEMVSTLKTSAGSYARFTSTKDFAGINVEAMKTKKVIDDPVVGTGASSVIVAGFDKEMSFNVRPSSNNKRVEISITQSANTGMDSIQLQDFEDELNGIFVSNGGIVTGYTATGADGNITVSYSR